MRGDAVGKAGYFGWLPLPTIRRFGSTGRAPPRSVMSAPQASDTRSPLRPVGSSARTRRRLRLRLR